ncbi:MAG: hypothetical protein NXI21_12225 [Alphaproteobacteria bacterium]|nr:hypothetical protein [Alphaproteobacteria bacterium]
MRKTLFSVVTAAAMAVGAHLAPASAAELGATYEEILAGAKEEGRLVVWSNFPSRPETHQALIAAFNERFGLETELEWVPLSSPQANSRAIAEAAGRQVSVDVIGAGSIGEVKVASDGGIITPYDWVGVFGEQFPEIGEVDGPAEFEGLALSYFVAHSVMGWNPGMIEGEEVPNSWFEVADSKWAGKFSANAYWFWPLPVLSLCIGEEESYALADKFIANTPVLGKGSPAVNQAITTGQVPIGFTLSLVAANSLRKEEPLDFKMFRDYLPYWDNYLWALDGSPNPNTARLFSAWMAVEGYKVADPIEPLPSRLDSDNIFVKMMADQEAATGAQTCTMETSEDIAQMDRVRQTVSAKMSGQQ